MLHLTLGKNQGHPPIHLHFIFKMTTKELESMKLFLRLALLNLFTMQSFAIHLFKVSPLCLYSFRESVRFEMFSISPTARKLIP